LANLASHLASKTGKTVGHMTKSWHNCTRVLQ